MKRRFVAYAVVFAASVAAGYVSAKSASAATNVTMSFHAQPVHYGYHPPVRHYGPVPWFYPRGYFSPKFHYGPRNPAAYWKWHNRDWRDHDRRRDFHDRRDRKHRDRHDRDRHDRDRHDRDRHDRDRHWRR